MKLKTALQSLTPVPISNDFSKLLLQLGSFPSRPAAECLQKLLQIQEISQLRRAFSEIKYNSTRTDTCNLLVDKHLSLIPWECLPTLSAVTFNRLLPLSTTTPKSKDSVFYIINPSGDLIKTQERFESLFNRYKLFKATYLFSLVFPVGRVLWEGGQVNKNSYKQSGVVNFSCTLATQLVKSTPL